MRRAPASPRGLKRTRLSLLSLALVVGLIAAACGGDSGSEPPPGGSGDDAQKGGTLRRETTSFEFTNGFDPTGEYLGSAWAVYSNLLLRTLVNTDHVSGDAGNELHPDLAADMPEVSDDGKTYTFTLKDGVKFAPPVDREVTSKDVLYAFERIGTASLVAQYGFYYNGTIEGMQDFVDGKAKTITGIETPDDKTIVFHLTKATGDFLYRLGMPATAPVPKEVGKCFTEAGEYGRYVISTGPYMFEGSEDLNIDSCGSMKPIKGFDPTRSQVFVRNPNYDPATDTTDMRENFFDRYEYTINTNENDIFNRVENGDIEVALGPTPQVIRKYLTTPDLKDKLKVDAGDRIWYIFFNLTQPPFDDVHVRKAASLVVDKDGLLRAWGGETQGEVATHIVPDTMLNGALDDYDPYPSQDHTGDLDAAKEEMKQSKYDSDGDGVCDAPECKDVLHISRNTSPWTEMDPIIEASLEKIGITLTTRELADAYPPVQDVSRQVPISTVAGWGKDYPDPYTFVGFLFDGRGILCTGNSNYSLVGLTEDQAKECGTSYPADGVPSVNDDIDACVAILDTEERLGCWTELDKKLMEEVVPWIPYLDATNTFVVSDAVTNYTYDQFSGDLGFAHIAVSSE